MNAEISKLFTQHFGHPPAHVVRSPGRLELLGNHTDYNQGLVLSLAIDRFLWMAVSPRDDRRVELISSGFSEREIFEVGGLHQNPDAPWANYVKGVLQQLGEHGVSVTGFNAAVHSTIPPGSGLSSSAALEVATALAFQKLQPYALAVHGSDQRLAMAKLCQRAENQFVGVQCGLLDQISCLFGRAGHAIETDFASLEVQLVPIVGSVAVVVCDTGAPHELVGGEYNSLRQLCENAASRLGVSSLRQVTLDELQARCGTLPEREFRCAHHVVAEIDRVRKGAAHLRTGQLREFGQLLLRSHASSQNDLGNSTKALDLLVELAREQRGCYGARLTGGGFGGATVNLVEEIYADEFILNIAAQYEQRSGFKTRPFRCRIADGAA